MKMTCAMKIAAGAAIIAAELGARDADDAWRRSVTAHLAVTKTHDTTCDRRLGDKSR